MDTRKTFVLWVGNDKDEILEGRLEDVDTGREMRFRSVEQLVAFLKQCVKSELKNGGEDFEQ